MVRIPCNIKRLTNTKRGVRGMFLDTEACLLAHLIHLFTP